jgi:predicted metalloprotease
MPAQRNHLMAVLVAAVTLGLLAGCGDDNNGDDPVASTGTSATTTQAAAAQPKAIGAAVPGSKGTTADLAKLPAAPEPSEVKTKIKGVSDKSTAQALDILDQDLFNFWGAMFTQAKLEWPAMKTLTVTKKPAATDCKTQVGPDDPPALCGDTFYWGITWFEQNIAPLGDAAVGIEVSIFWSLHVQDLLGFTKALSDGKMSKADYGNQTLCLSGLWAHSVNERKFFEKGDAEEVIAQIQNISSIDSIKAPDITPESLGNAFAAGLDSGSPRTCIGGE